MTIRLIKERTLKILLLSYIRLLFLAQITAEFQFIMSVIVDQGGLLSI